MLCENCGKREANVRYSENINGVKKEMHLCEECSRKLGIAQDMDFKIPALDFSNFFGSFLEDFNTPDFMPLLNEVKQLKCDSCGSTFEDIIDTGRYGCPNCYDVFEDRMDPILKKLQGANRHVGRLGKISNNNLKFQDKESKKEKYNYKPTLKGLFEMLRWAKQDINNKNEKIGRIIDNSKQYKILKKDDIRLLGSYINK